ncbi:MAG TPA: OmpA family protein, partial [Hyphomicrobiaceae bacterium]|nr:OmpA family protein [Hyphomicrobiaceae bacterium]
RCNPWRWLWGLVPLALVVHIAVVGERRAIETDLERRAGAALAEADLQWASLKASGRDIVVTGRAAAESEKRKAIDVVSRQKGVRAVDDRIELVAVAPQYVWSAAQRGNRLVLAGHVPNEAIRKAIVGTAKATFPGRELDDEMQLARGVPDQDRWLGAVSFGLKLLARMKPGSYVRLAQMRLAIDGEAEDSSAYQTLSAALTGGLPDGMEIATNKLVPPRVKPYVWSAALRGQQLELAGYAPGERQREEVFQAARKAFPERAIVERMSMAAGEPQGWLQAVGAALTALAALEEGQVELTDAQLAISGFTPLEDTADVAVKELRSALPSSFRLTHQIRWKEPAAAKAAEAARLAVLAEEEARRKAAEEEARRKAAEEEARRKAELARCRQELADAVTPGDITFATDKADLDPRGRAALDRFAEVAARCACVNFEIAGHADARGSPASKQELSERRAQAVVDYLVRAGIDRRRMSAAGYADTLPLAANDSERHRAKNRRVEIRVR